MSDNSETPATFSGPPFGPQTGVAAPIFRPFDWLALLMTFLVSLLVYLCTIAPDVTLEFSGYFSTSADYAGVAQPPGYPLWTLYSWLFIHLFPVSTVAWRVAAGSAVAAALACGLVALMASRAAGMVLPDLAALTPASCRDRELLRLVCGVVAGTVFGLSTTVWRSAVVAEVWALRILLASLLLCLVWTWMSRPSRRGLVYCAGCAFGLLLAGSQELIVLTPGLLLCILVGEPGLGRDLSLPIALVATADWLTSEFRLVWLSGSDYVTRNIPFGVSFVLVGVAGVYVTVRTRQFGGEWKSASLCLLALFLGLACYFYLPVTSMTNPPANWGYPRTEEGFFHLVTRGQYEHPNPTREPGRFVVQLWDLAADTVKHLGWPCLVCAIVPFAFWRRTTQKGRHLLASMAISAVCLGPLLVALLNPGRDLSSRQFIAPYFGPMFIPIAGCAGVGLEIIGRRIVRFR